MAGSLSYQVYKSDNGVSYAILCDLSNALALNASASASPGTLPPTTLPRNITPRYALFVDASGKIRRKVPLLTAADVGALVAGKTFTPPEESVGVTLTYVRGETIRIPHLVDTGRTN